MANLSPIDFVHLINHLARREALCLSKGAIVETTTALSTADGGIDGVARWSDGGEPTQYLPARETAWQCKSGERLKASAFAAEVSSNGTLRPALVSLFERGGAYVIFTSADMTPQQKQQALSAMRAVAPTFAQRFHVVAGDDIAAWASRDLWARTFLIRSAGRNGPGTLLTFDEWAARFKNEYVWTDEHRSAAAKIGAAISSPTQTYRISGTPGIGKTRFVLEAVRELPEAGHRVVYYDARPFEDHSELLSAIRNWTRLHVSGVLVVDNCDPLLEQEIKAATTGSMISAVTIAEKRESQFDYEVRKVSRDVIQKILEHSSPNPNHRAIHLAIGYAEGWPSIALRVYDSIKNGVEDASTLTDEVLTRRLTTITGASDETEVLRALSIFDHVGYREDVSNQWKRVRDLLTPDIPERRFYAIARQYEQLGIVRSHGRFWRVGPPPLAIRLMKEWLDQSVPEVLNELFQKLPAEMQSAIGSRLEEISTPAAVEIAERLLAGDGHFGQRDHIFTRAGSLMLCSLAQVAPGAACNAIHGAIFDSSVDLKSIGQHEGRQNLVFALEYVAFHKDFFIDAASCLLALAHAENASNSNNATGTLVKLFHIQGSQTEAPPELRYQVVENILSYTDDDTVAIASKVLAAMLSDGGGYVRLGPEMQGGRPILVEWQPKFWHEIYDYWSAAVDYCLKLAALTASGREYARKVFADALPALVRHRQWDSASRGILHLRGGAWPLAIERLTWTIRVAMAKYDEADVAKAQELMKLLEPDTLDSLIEVRLINPPRELFEDENGHFRNFAELKAEEFARQSVADGSFSSVFSAISTGYPQFAFTYGVAAAQYTENLEHLAAAALDSFRAAPEPRNDLALTGVFMVLSDRDRALRERLLDAVTSDDKLVDALPAISTAPNASDKDVERLVRAYAKGNLGPPRQMVFMGKRFSEASPDKVRELIEVLIQRNFFVSAFELLTYGVESSRPYLDLYARAIVMADVINNELPQTVDYSVLEKARKIIEHGDVVFATAVASSLIGRSLSERPLWERDRGSDLWPAILKHGGDVAWNMIRQRFAGLAKRERWLLLSGLQYRHQGTIGQRLALEELGLDRIVEFAQQYPDDVPVFLARDGNAVDVDPQFVPDSADETVQLTPLFRKLLEVFGERDDVLSGLSAGLHGFASVGPRAPYYARRLKLIESIPTFGRAKLESWKRALRADFDAERKRAGLHDDELEGAIF